MCCCTWTTDHGFGFGGYCSIDWCAFLSPFKVQCPESLGLNRNYSCMKKIAFLHSRDKTNMTQANPLCYSSYHFYMNYADIRAEKSQLQRNLMGIDRTWDEAAASELGRELRRWQFGSLQDSFNLIPRFSVKFKRASFIYLNCFATVRHCIFLSNCSPL